MERRESAEISQLLSIGFLTDRLLLALDVHGVDGVASKEPKLLSDLADLLDALIELGERPSALLSRQTATFAFPAAEYVVLELVRGQLNREELDAAVQQIKGLKETVEAIEARRSPATTATESLRRFLEQLAETSLEQVDDYRMRAEAGRTERTSLIEWQKTSAG